MIRVLSAIVTMLILLCICVMATGCGNKRMFDTTWTFERAIIFLPDGEKIEGKISTWDDFESSDMIQVTIDGKTYLTHSSNIIMISE
jgi:hypothetical protein